MNKMSTKVFRLVKPGLMDRIIAVENLPDEYTAGVWEIEPNGFPREWKMWLEAIGSKNAKGNGVFFGLEYIAVNSHAEKWQEIASYVRRSSDASIRLLDRLEDMAKPLASGQTSPIELHPEDVPVITLKVKEPATKQPIEVKSVPADATVPQVEEPRKRGRPAKVKDIVKETVTNA